MSDPISKNKFARGFALAPVGIGSVIGTVYLTNFSKPLNLLDSLDFDNRPEVKEEILTPVLQMPPPGGGGGGGEGQSSGSDGSGSSESSDGDSTTQEEGESENQDEEQQSTDADSKAEKSVPASIEIDGIEPEKIIKQVVSNITNYNWNKKIELATLDWLLKNLREGTLAVKKIKIDALKKQIEEKQAASASNTSGTSDTDSPSSGETTPAAS